jgi:hypothetical protein
LLATIGVKEILYVLAALSVVGAVETLILIPETKGKALEELGKELQVQEISSLRFFRTPFPSLVCFS